MHLFHVKDKHSFLPTTKDIISKPFNTESYDMDMISTLQHPEHFVGNTSSIKSCNSRFPIAVHNESELENKEVYKLHIRRNTHTGNKE